MKTATQLITWRGWSKLCLRCCEDLLSQHFVSLCLIKMFCFKLYWHTESQETLIIPPFRWFKYFAKLKHRCERWRVDGDHSSVVPSHSSCRRCRHFFNHLSGFTNQLFSTGTDLRLLFVI